MGLRRKAREMALQTMFAMDFTERDPELGELSLLNHYQEILMEIASVDEIEETDKRFVFAEELIRRTIQNMPVIDEMIVKYAKNWSLERIAWIDRNILRLAIYEILYTEVPPAIAINEAIEIAKRFSTEQSGKFINGILDNIYNETKKTHGTEENA